ncbi:ankyrin repeat-containing protein ITN1-like [Rhododendron vialii]|uniref:ankyrin repeat-containing protein ITN1-like n=1 Tax=Rhododendron vialii TaxID=182163 RepID=UPI00265F838E|nr:ankyrin repeat-containing protein ITN1-like [Rhododendron vialii]
MKFANPRDIDWLNDDMETPATLFIREHEKLRAKGEKWMKETANSCTIPAALVVTVVFAAAIQYPGGYNRDGLPNFSTAVAFYIFVVFNAISLFASTTSLLVSLSILTSRYNQDDFHHALPERLVKSLFTLFVSITSMVVAFICALYIMLGNKPNARILCLVAVLANIPIHFAWLHLPLLLDLITPTYCPRIFGKQSDRPFY